MERIDKNKPVMYCQEPSDKYLTLLEEAGGDPRLAAGMVALRDLQRTGGWQPAIDARDASGTSDGNFWQIGQEAVPELRCEIPL